MKRLAIPLCLGFGAALAFLIGQRMSADAMAVVVGVAVGVAASVPASILLVALLRRERRGWQSELLPAGSGYGNLASQSPQPNVIVLNPGDLWGQRQSTAPYIPLPPEMPVDGGLRRLHVVGDDDDWA